MKIKLVIDGSDMRVRIQPENSADRKILEFVAQMDIARIKTEKEQEYGYSAGKIIKTIDLCLELEKTEDDSVRIVDYPVTK